MPHYKTRHFSPPVQQHHTSSHLPFIVDSPTTTVDVGLYRPGRSLPQSHDPRRLRQRQEFTSHSQSAVDLANTLRQITLDQSEGQPLELQDQFTGYQTGPRLCDAVSQKLDDVITGIDCGTFSGNEADLVITSFQPALRGGDSRNRGLSNVNEQKNATKPRAVVHNHFSKVHFYANSTLPPHLSPVKFYIATYPLLCLAAQYSRRVYEKPTGPERRMHIEAHNGTKAMVINSVPIDDMNTIVFAIRGTQSFRDWTVNLKTHPTSARDFLDDAGNLCHAGFLYVARKMLQPVAARLKELLKEDPNRASCSLLITGHSAGGAIASLLYCHMLSRTVRSDLTHLRGFFKRIHCVTFGAPPVSLLPLDKPSSSEYRKSIFFSFINEGDPVTRADRAYVRSLLELYISPLPGPSFSTTQIGSHCSNSTLNLSEAPPKFASRYWPVPTSTLSNAGRLVLLRETPARKHSPNQETGDVGAYGTTDQELRGVVFGDPLVHVMELYERRVERLATNAVTAKLST